MNIKDIIKNINWTKLVAGLFVGAVGGYAYYYYVGCQSGTCAIQSDPVIMTLYGAGMGGVLFFSNKRKPEDKS